MRVLLMTTTLLVAGALSAGCGGDDGGSSAAEAGGSPSASASTATEFCTAYNSLSDAFPAGTQPTDKQAVAAIKDWADEMTSTGTPANMPADAKKGFDLVTATVDKIKPDASRAEIQKLSADLTPDQQAQSQAFGAYATKTCPTESATPAPSPSPTK